MVGSVRAPPTRPYPNLGTRSPDTAKGPLLSWESTLGRQTTPPPGPPGGRGRRSRPAGWPLAAADLQTPAGPGAQGQLLARRWPGRGRVCRTLLTPEPAPRSLHTHLPTGAAARAGSVTLVRTRGGSGGHVGRRLRRWRAHCQAPALAVGGGAQTPTHSPGRVPLPFLLGAAQHPTRPPV